MTTPDWPALYASEVTPAMERFAAPPPIGVWIFVTVLILIGLALAFFTSGTTRLAGLVPFFAAGFVLFMVVGTEDRVGQPATYRVGTVVSLDQEKVVESTTTGVDRPRIIYTVELQVSEHGRFDATGASPGPAADLGVERLFLPESISAQLEVGQRAILASYPGSSNSVAFALDEAGAVLR